MYGIPSDFDPSVLKAREVVQIVTGMYQVVINFADDVSVSIEGQFDHHDSQQLLSVAQELHLRAGTLVSLLGATVTGATRKDASVLALTFSNGERLEVFDSNDFGESFQVHTPSHTIVV